MKNVKIKKIQLLNFKGIRTMEVEFAGAVTSIYGRNASGKSTIFDAFTWLLFGKNSDDKAKFNIKTLNAQGEVIERLPHEVTAVLEVDGKEVRLTKRLKEKWTKKKGSSTEEFTGNEEERLYNDVPMSVKEWNEKINGICSEDVFRMITNPLYFPTMQWQKQREALISMAGDVSIDDVIKTSPAEFATLIDALNGKTMEEFKREVIAKKKRIKEDVDTIPARINERMRDVNTTYDFNLITAILNHKLAKADEVLEKLNDARKMIIASGDADAVADERKKLKAEIAICKAKLEEQIQSAYTAQLNRHIKCKTELANAEIKMQYTDTQIHHTESELAYLKSRRAELLARYKQLKSQTLQFSDDDVFVCPTCGRPLDAEQRWQKQQEMIQNFNNSRSKNIEENIAEGKKIKEQIDVNEVRLTGLTNEKDVLTAQIERIKADMPEEPQPLTKEDIDKMIVKDEPYLRLCKRLADYDKEHTAVTADNTLQEQINALSQEHKTLSDEIAELKTQLAIKEVNDANEKRIGELQEQLREASSELARLEGLEFTIQEFTKARITMLEERINALFSFVRFKMFETQINGGEVETCKAVVNGVPFDDLNNAMKINAGLDIINAICKSLQITAPIFIDNSESVNKLTTTESQVIRLVVSEDETLRIA